MISPNEARFLEVLKRLRSFPLFHLPDEIKLSRPAVTLISWIDTSPGCGVVDIADGLGLSPPTISVGIRRLVKSGWLEQRQDPDDGRAKLIYLTPKGDELMYRLRIHQKGIFNIFLSTLDLEEQNHLLGLLEKALDSIEDLQGEFQFKVS
jgi:DNA-binding MarR family transcriptional regulator